MQLPDDSSGEPVPLRNFDDPHALDVAGRYGVVESLHAEAEFNRRLIESIDDCIKILDLDGRIVSLNPGGAKLLGITDVAAFLGTSWFDLWIGGDRATAREAVAQALAGATGRFSGWCDVASERRCFHVIVTAMLDPQARPERLLAVSRDITLERRSTEALAESEARYRAFTQALPGITWSADAAGNLDFITEQYRELRGRDETTALGDRWLRNVHPDDRETTRERWAHAIRTGEPYDADFRVLVGDGTYRWQLVRALPLRDDAGAIVRWIGVNVDVDDHRRADEAREMFVALAENSNDFIAISDLAGNVGYVNGAGRRLLEIDLPQAGPIAYSEIHSASERDFVATEMMPALLRDGRWNGELEYRSFRTNVPIPVSVNAFGLVDRRGVLSGLATVSSDRRPRIRIDAGLRLLSRTGSVMFDSLDFVTTLHNVAQAFLPEYASYCVIDTLDDARRWRRTVVHPDPSLESIVLELPQPVGSHPVARALDEGTSSCVLVDDAFMAAVGLDSPRAVASRLLGTRSFVTVPVITPAGRIVGGLTCARDDKHPRGAFETEDVAFIEETGRRAGAALANARLYERERRVAVELQTASLPTVLPELPGVHISADYRPGSDEAMIGGDWYDAFVLEDGRVAITVGDVVGHGLGAAIKMTKLRQSMQAAAMIDPDPVAMLTVADKTLRLIDPDAFATAIAAIYDPSSRTLRFAIAGHPNPIVRDPLGNVLDYRSEGFMLGLRAGVQSGVYEIPVPPGSTVVFFTDGLVELTRDIAAGHARLLEVLLRADLAREPEPARSIVTAVLGAETGKDDIAVLVLRIAPAPLEGADDAAVLRGAGV